MTVVKIKIENKDKKINEYNMTNQSIMKTNISLDYSLLVIILFGFILPLQSNQLLPITDNQPPITSHQPPTNHKTLNSSKLVSVQVFYTYTCSTVLRKPTWLVVGKAQKLLTFVTTLLRLRCIFIFLHICYLLYLYVSSVRKKIWPKN